MKFMATWNVHADKRHPALEQLAQMSLEDFKTQHGDKIKLIGRWHDLTRFRGVAIFETDDVEALHLWLLRWNGILDFDIAPVVDDDEVHATANKFSSAS